MSSSIRWCIGVLLGAIALAGCGEESNEFPPNAAFTVGDKVVTEAQLDRSVEMFFPTQGGYAKRFGPPAYPDCMAAKRKLDVPATSGGSKVAEWKRICKGEFEASRTLTLAYLIRGAWLELEAHRRGLPPPEGVPTRLRVSGQQRTVEGSMRVSQADIARFAEKVVQGTELAELSPDVRRNLVHNIKARQLDRMLKARYAADTRCARRYRKEQVPLCGPARFQGRQFF